MCCSITSLTSVIDEIVLNIFQSLQKTDMQDASLVSYTRR